MRTQKMKKLTCLFLAIALVFGLLPSSSISAEAHASVSNIEQAQASNPLPASAPNIGERESGTNYLDTIEAKGEKIYDAISKEQIDAWKAVNRDNRASGLIGFEGEYELDGKTELVSVIVEFINQPAAVALADAKISGIAPMSMNIYSIKAKADNIQFKQNLDSMFRSKARTASDTYQITAEYTDSINGMSLTIPANRVAELAEMDCVYAVYPDITVYAHDISGNELYATGDKSGMGKERNLLGIDALHDAGIKGAGVVVGVLDTGVDYNHPDLKDAFSTTYPGIGSPFDEGALHPYNGKYYGRNFVEIDGRYRDDFDSMETTYEDYQAFIDGGGKTIPGDTYYTSHGTHVSGTIAARGQNNGDTSALGMAPEATLLAYRVLGPYGSGKNSWILSGIDSVYRDGCDIVNMSLGSANNNPFDITATAVNNVIMAYDIIFAISAGNNGPGLDTLGSPGSSTLAITVANGTVNKTNTDVTATAGDKSALLRLLAKDTQTDIASDMIGNEYNFARIMDTDGKALGIGTASEFQAAGDLTGKIAVVARGQAFYETAVNAKIYGAAAVIVINYERGGTVYSFQFEMDECVPIFLTHSYTDGMALLAAGDGRIKMDSQRVSSAPVNDSSSRGPAGLTYDIKPDIVAPGTDVLSTVPYFMNDPHGDESTRYNTAYDAYSGTSMSSPHIAGIAALLLGNNPSLTAMQIKARLMNTADKVADHSVHVVGAGYVNPAKAIETRYYATVRQQAPVAGSVGEYYYEMMDVDVASLNFGTFFTSLDGTESGNTQKTLTVTVYNTSATARVLAPKATFNSVGQNVKSNSKIKITYSTTSVVVPANGKTSFDVTISVPNNLIAANAGSYEGYVTLTDVNGAGVSLPFAAQVLPLDLSEAFTQLFLNKPVIAGNTSNKHLEQSSTSDLFYTINRDISYILPLIVDNDDPSKVLGWLGYTENFTGVWDYADAMGNYTYYRDDFIPQNGYYPVTEGSDSSFSDELVPFEEGFHTIGLLVRLADGNYQEFTIPFYVDTDAPVVTINGLNDNNLNFTGDPSSFQITGTVFDNGTAKMEAANVQFEFFVSLSASQGLNAVIAELNGAYYPAVVLPDGTFTIDLPGINPLLDHEDVKLYALDAFTLRSIEGYDDHNTVRDFDPTQPSYQINNGSYGYFGNNMAQTDITLTYDSPYMTFNAQSATLYVGDTFNLDVLFNSKASDDLVQTWFSDKPAVATVSGSGTNATVTATGIGTAVIKAVSEEGLVCEFIVTVNERLGDGVHLPADSFVYYGKYNHLSKAGIDDQGNNSGYYGYDLLEYEEADTPILWRVMGSSGTLMSIMSEYVIDVIPYYPSTYMLGQLDNPTKYWSNSLIRAWLNNYAFESITDVPDYDRTVDDYSNPSFLEAFTDEELANIPIIPDVTMKNPKPYEVLTETTSDRVYLPDAYDWEDSLVTWSGDHRQNSNLESNAAGLKNGSDTRGIYYWLRSPWGGYEPLIGSDPGYVMYTGAYQLSHDFGDDNAEYTCDIYRTFSLMNFGIRPVTNIDTDTILYAAEVEADDALYTLPKSGSAYKLTVLGGNGGNDIGWLSPIAPEVNAVSGSDLVIPYVASSKSGGDYKIAYKIVGGEMDNRQIVSYGEIDTVADTSQNLTINTAGLENGSYTLYLWLQKNNSDSSNAAGVVSIVDLTVAEAEENPLTGIAFDRDTINFASTYTDSYPINVSYTPTDADNTGLDWNSSDETVAIVDQNGMVTPVGVGMATITAMSQLDPMISDNCLVTVLDTVDIPITGIELENGEPTLMMTVGESAAITVEITPSNATIQNLYWESTDPESIIVDQNGNVTAVKQPAAGTYSITATAVDGSGETASISVMVMPDMTASISLNETAINMQNGEAFQLTASILPAGFDQRVTWSSDGWIVEVDPTGRVTAVGNGTATVTATSVANPTLTATCTVSVETRLTSLSFTQSVYNIKVGETKSLTLNAEPFSADYSLSWTNSAPAVLELNEGMYFGSMKGLTIGTSYLTATDTTTGLIATCTVNVLDPSAVGPSVVSMSQYNFNKNHNNADYKDIEIPFNLGSGGLEATDTVKVSIDAYILVKDRDYKFEGSTLTLFKEYLETLPVKTSPPPYRISVILNDPVGNPISSGAFFVYEEDSDPEIAITDYDYWTTDPQDIAIDFYLGSGSTRLTGITQVELREELDLTRRYLLVPSTDYTIVGSTLTLKKEFIENYRDEAFLPIAISFSVPSGGGQSMDRVMYVYIHINPTPLTGVILTPETMTLGVGETAQLNVGYEPFNARERDVEWETSNGSIVQVYNGGVIIAQTIGTATITVKSASTPLFSDTCVVTVTSVAATPTVEINNNSLAAKVGQPVVLYAVASVEGEGSLSYQWYDGETPMPGATNAFITANTQVAGLKNYHVVVTNTDETVEGRKTTSVKSDIIALTVIDYDNAALSPVITSQPQSITVRQGMTATLSVEAYSPDNGQLSYLWYAVDPYTVMPSNSASFDADTSQLGTKHYRVEITNTTESGKTRLCSSMIVSVTVEDALIQSPQFTLHPADYSVEKDTAVTLTTAATVYGDGDAVITYQWYKNTVNLNMYGTAIDGATASTYTPDTSVGGEYYYYVVATNGNRSVASHVSAITVMFNAAAPTIIVQPTVPAGVYPVHSAIAMTVGAVSADGGTLSYQWFRVWSAWDVERITGATGATYYPDTSETGSATYYVVVTNTNNAATNNKTASVQSFMVTVVITPTAPAINSITLSNGMVGNAYSQSFTAIGDNPMEWSITSGSLPAGLEFSVDGKLTGTPTQSGSFTFTVTAINQLGSDDAELSLTISSQPAGPSDPGSAPSPGGSSTSTTPPAATQPYLKVESSAQPGGTLKADVVLNRFDELFAEMLEQQSTSIIVKVALPNGTDKTDFSDILLSIPSEVLEAITSEEDINLQIEMPFATITFDSNAITAIANAGNGDMTLSMRLLSEENLAEALAGSELGKIGSRPAFDITVKKGNKIVHNLKDGKATISIPYTLAAYENPNAIVAYSIGNDGKADVVRGHYRSGSKTVEMIAKHFSIYAIGYNPVSFADVPDYWAKDAIEFISARGITRGVSENEFAPGNQITRADFLVMIMRAFDIQPMGSLSNNFSDAGNTYYTQYLATAKQLGLAHGVGDNMFAPESTITRQEIITLICSFLAYVDEPLTPKTGTKPFSSYADANTVSDWAVPSVKSMVESGIITGDGTNIMPYSMTKRDQVARILYTILTR